MKDIFKTEKLIADECVMDSRYEIRLPMIGQGTYSEIYKALDRSSNDYVAVKVLKPGCEPQQLASMIRKEVAVLQECSSRSSYFARCLGKSKLVVNKQEYSCMVMSLLGPNLGDILKAQKSKRFHPSTAFALGVKMIDAIRSMHEIGYIHRDIKPGNFCVGASGGQHECADLSRVFIVDLGLAKKYRLDDGSHVHMMRTSKEFRGSPNYASVNAYGNIEQSRRDDLFSLLYVLVEMIDGVLPWRKVVSHYDKSTRVPCYMMKKYCLAYPQHLCSTVSTPKVLIFFSDYLRSLEFADVPDYEYLKQLLSSEVHEHSRVLDIDPPSLNRSVESSDPAKEQAIKKQKLSQLYEAAAASSNQVQVALASQAVQTKVSELFINHFEADQWDKEATFLRDCGVGMLHRPDRKNPPCPSNSRDVDGPKSAELKRILQELGTVNVDRVCSPTEALSLSRTAAIDLLTGLEEGVSLPSSDEEKALRQISEIRRLFDLVESRIVNRSTPLDRLCEDLDGWTYANGQRYSKLREMESDLQQRSSAISKQEEMVMEREAQVRALEENVAYKENSLGESISKFQAELRHFEEKKAAMQQREENLQRMTSSLKKSEGELVKLAENLPGRRGNSVQESAKMANQTLKGISLAQKLEKDPDRKLVNSSSFGGESHARKEEQSEQANGDDETGTKRKRLQRTENKFPGSPYLTVAKGAGSVSKSDLQAAEKAEEGEIS